jgi:hypothetical protein
VDYLGGFQVQRPTEQALLGVVEPGATATAIELERERAPPRPDLQLRTTADHRLIRHGAADPENRRDLVVSLRLVTASKDNGFKRSLRRS